MQHFGQYSKNTLTTHLLFLLLIGVAGILSYSNTFAVPFQWDGEIFIKDNPIIKDFGYFLEPAQAKGSEFYGALKSRYVGYLTFALNYKIGGLDVTGFHIFNIAIHILNAFLVYALVLLTFRTPFLKESGLSEPAGYIALFSSLLFVAHPIQTEAVTYIFQRLASVVAFFYLLSLTAYIKSRQTAGFTAFGFYAVSLVAAVLAMKTKENAFTLPIIIALYEFLFFTGPVAKRLLRLLPLLLTLCIIPLALASINKPAGEVISGVAPATRGYEGLSRGDYLLSQFRVIVTYLRLLILPVNQNLDYDYPVFRSLFEPAVFLSFLLLLSIVLLALSLLYRSLSKERGLRFIAFGIFWFFITISVESSLVPIPVLLDEYRLYLPSAGAFFAVTAGSYLLLGERNDRKKIFFAGILVLVAILALTTYKRNGVWQTKITLWEDVVKKSPSLVYSRNNLGVAYMEADRLEEAVRQFQAALVIKPDHETAYNNLGLIYSRQGQLDKAEYAFRRAITIKPDYAKALNNLGVVYARQGRVDEAMQAFQSALSMKDDVVDAYNNLGILYIQKGMFREAEQALRTAMKLSPDYAKAHYNLGLVYEQQGLLEKARREYEAALRLDPSYDMARTKLQQVAR